MQEPATAAMSSTIQSPPSRRATPAPVSPDPAVMAHRLRGWPDEATRATSLAASSRVMSSARSLATT